MHEWHDIRLTAGEHDSPADGLCLMEAVALFAGERHRDWPTCVCPVLIEFGRVLNDTMPDQWRTDLLLPLVPVLVGTRDPLSDSCGINATGLERQRAAALLAWCVNRLEAVAIGDDEAELHARGARRCSRGPAVRPSPARCAQRRRRAGLGSESRCRSRTRRSSSRRTIDPGGGARGGRRQLRAMAGCGRRISRRGRTVFRREILCACRARPCWRCGRHRVGQRPHACAHLRRAYTPPLNQRPAVVSMTLANDRKHSSWLAGSHHDGVFRCNR